MITNADRCVYSFHARWSALRSTFPPSVLLTMSTPLAIYSSSTRTWRKVRRLQFRFRFQSVNFFNPAVSNLWLYVVIMIMLCYDCRPVNVELITTDDRHMQTVREAATICPRPMQVDLWPFDLESGVPVPSLLGRCKQKQRGLRGLLCRCPSITEWEMYITAQGRPPPSPKWPILCRVRR